VVANENFCFWKKMKTLNAEEQGEQRA
jgi:hypothetical protein